jgi:hypothetical protein
MNKNIVPSSSSAVSPSEVTAPRNSAIAAAAMADLQHVQVDGESAESFLAEKRLGATIN